MAVVTLKSSAITNRDAVPAVISNSMITRGEVKQAYGYVSAANGDSVGSKYVMCQVPSNARVSNVEIQSDAMGTSAAGDVGVYYNTVDGGAVISAAFFGSAIAVATALAATNVTNESGTYTLDKQELPLWSALGLSADPGKMLDVVVTVTAAMAAAGKIALKVSYVE